MTLSEAIEEVYTRTDEQSDLDPYVGDVIDITSPGAVLLRRALNTAQRIVSTWKYASGTRIRFRACQGEGIVHTNYETVQITSWPAANVIGWNVPLAMNGAFRLGVISITLDDISTDYLITDSSQTTCTLAGDLNADPSGTEAYVRFTRYEPNVSDGWTLIDYIGMNELVDLNDLNVLSRGTAHDTFTSSLLNKGTPSSWTYDGQYVVFDSAPEEERSMLARYFRYPSEVTLLTDSFRLPEAFHEAIVQWACWWAFKRIGENTSAYAQMRTLQELMITLRTEYDFDQDSNDPGRLEYIG